MSRTISRGLLLVVFAGCGHPTLEREYDTLVKDRDDQIKTGIEKAVGEMKEKLAEAEQRAKTAESRAKAAEEKLLASECRSETQPKESQTVRVFKDKVARFLEEARAGAKQLKMAPTPDEAKTKYREVNDFYVHVPEVPPEIDSTGELAKKLLRVNGSIYVGAEMIKLGSDFERLGNLKKAKECEKHRDDALIESNRFAREIETQLGL